MKLPNLLIGAVLSVLVAAPIAAQDSDVPTRFPADGIAILDCAPGEPAPQNSCIVRLPPKVLRNALSASNGVSFNFARPGDAGFPDDVDLSATALLLDISPGPGSRRREVFAQEKQLLREFIEQLPQGESLALYAFNERLNRLVDFTDERSRVLAALDEVELAGTNTRIANYAQDVIDVLDARNDALLKTLILITDGDEEGISAVAEVTRAAQDADVTIMALGMEWRGVGDSEAGKGMDYLERLAEGASGAAQTVYVRQGEEARDAIGDFAQDISASRRGSGLIVVDGTPTASDITVELREPEPGASGSYRPREIKVRYEPVVDTTEGDAEPDVAPVDELNLIAGFPANYVYAAAAILGIFMLGLIFLLARKKAPAVIDTGPAWDDGLSADRTVLGAHEDDAKTQMVSPASAVAHAYLLREDDHNKMPISSQRASIGRGSANAVVINHTSISRVHAELHRNRDGGFSVTDMDSLNGTFVNDSKVSGTMAVRIGDKIKFGEVTTKLVLN